MKTLILVCSALAAAEAFALVVRPQTLSASPWIDTETTTNLPFAGHPTGNQLRDFHVGMSFVATPSNNVQVAFGRDADEDGALSLEETDLTIGWDCGKWWERGMGDEGVGMREEAWLPVTAAAEKDFLWTLRMRDGRPLALTVTENGEALSSETNAVALARLYDPGWNLVRVTVRGVDDAAERLVVAAHPWGMVLRFR